MNKEPRLARVKWAGPYDLQSASNLLDEEMDYGLYQIYGRHPIFGPGALLYVGKATRQCFGRRLRQHSEWLQDVDGVDIRIGRIPDEDCRSERDWEQLVSDAEKLTIYWHGVPYNSSGIAWYAGRPLRIQNWGKYGALHPEYTSEWPPLRPDDSEED